MLMELNSQAAIAQPGHFYAVGVGPGAPDLLTLRAARLIESAGVIVAPRSERSDESLALAAIRDLIGEQEVIENIYPMERDRERTEQCWRTVAEQVAERCARGLAVVQVTIGDPLIYSTSAYLIEALLDGLMPRERVHAVPGISAFQVAAARFIDPLTIQEDRLMLMPATDMEAVASALDRCETLVLYKVGPRLKALAALFRERGLLGQARLACRAEQGEGESYLQDLTGDLPGELGYMSIVIVRVGRKEWR
jgi:precorrin-2/cobalt-factor-2 C20-methyltransferase